MVQLTARVDSGASWFHPLAWIAWRQLVLEAEQAWTMRSSRVTSGPTMRNSW